MEPPIGFCKLCKAITAKNSNGRFSKRDEKSVLFYIEGKSINFSLLLVQ